VVVAGLAVAWFLFQHRPSKPSVELTQKRLKFNSSESPVDTDAISPDGKYLAYSDSAGIHVKLLSTGEEHLFPKPAGVSLSASWWLDCWFPDGTQLLADTWEPGGRESMWTVSVLGQSARKLRESAVSQDVSPDGTRIAFSPEPGASGNVREIWLMDSQGINRKRSSRWERTNGLVACSGRRTESVWPTLGGSALPIGIGRRLKPAT
jgi:Tol biopolymer transport system component